MFEKYKFEQKLSNKIMWKHPVSRYYKSTLELVSLDFMYIIAIIGMGITGLYGIMVITCIFFVFLAFAFGYMDYKENITKEYNEFIDKEFFKHMSKKYK